MALIDPIKDIYRLPDISEHEDLKLQTLMENCSVLEARLYEIVERLPEYERQIFEAYLDMRNDLEVETVKAALRLGKRHYK